jgi:hypothetical protein
LPEVPAICEQCGAIYPGMQLGGEGAVFYFQGGTAGPGQCPNCGGRVSIPDGGYRVVGNTLEVTSFVSEWSSERLSNLIDALNDARRSPNPQEAVEEALKSEPELYNSLKNSIVPRDPAAFWTFVSALLIVLGMFLHSGPNVTINERIVIEQMGSQAQQPQTPLAQTESQPDPGPKPPRSRTQQKKWDRVHKKHKRKH